MTKKNAATTKKFRGLRAAVVVVIIILTAGAIYIRGVKHFHKEELDKVKAEYQTFDQRVSRIEETKRQRIEFYKNRLLIDFPFKYSFTSSDFIRRIGLTRSGGIELSKIEIKPNGHSVHFSIAGNIEKGNKIVMESRFFRFKRAVEAFDDVILITGQKKPEDTSEKGLNFTLEGEIELL
ncbi:MAG: hypothetical protein KAT34_16295 [Candidatus Aminicenantes bacterium]|nr:hypothetical protein [Candidatus Aminicenantes bacterium]